MTMRLVRSSVLILGLPLVLGACSLSDPTVREGLWHPRGVNNGNLAAMVADPRDLVRGKSTLYSDGTLAAAAVDRLYRDKVKPAPVVGLALQGSATNAASSAGAPTDTSP